MAQIPFSPLPEGPSAPNVQVAIPTGLPEVFDKVGQISDQIQTKQTQLLAEKQATIDQQAAGSGQSVAQDDSNFPTVYADAYNNTAGKIFTSQKQSQLDAGLSNALAQHATDPAGFMQASEDFKGSFLANVPVQQQAQFLTQFNDTAAQYQKQAIAGQVSQTRSAATTELTSSAQTLLNQVVQMHTAGVPADDPMLIDKLAQRDAKLAALKDPGNLGGPLMSAEQVGLIEKNAGADIQEADIHHEMSSLPTLDQKEDFLNHLEATGDTSGKLDFARFNGVLQQGRKEIQDARTMLNQNRVLVAQDVSTASQYLLNGIKPDNLVDLQARTAALGDGHLIKQLSDAVATQSGIATMSTAKLSDMGTIVDNARAGLTGSPSTTPPTTINAAILGQESGDSDTAKTSVDGAVGPGQMTQATFDANAHPGERIDNPTDNRNVANRTIDKYMKEYNGDTARVAVAYFSGEPNVSPPGSATPYINDHVDGNGKTTSSYVADVTQRLSGGTTPSGDLAGYQAKKAFYERAQVALSTDPLKFGAENKSPNISAQALAPLDPTNAPQMTQRAADASSVSTTYGVPVSMFRPSDLENLKKQLPLMDAGKQVQLLDALNGTPTMTPQVKANTFASLQKEVPNIAFMAQMRGVPSTHDLTEQILDGQTFKTNNPEAVDKDKMAERAMTSTIQQLIPSEIDPSGTQGAKFVYAANGLFANYVRQNPNKFLTSTPVIPQDVTDGANAAVAKLFGYDDINKMPVGPTGQKVTPLERGMTDGTQHDIWNSLTDADLKAMNGGQQPTDTFGTQSAPMTADKIHSNTFPVATSVPGQFTFGFRDGQNNLRFVQGQNGKPLVWNYGANADAYKARTKAPPPGTLSLP